MANRTYKVEQLFDLLNKKEKKDFPAWLDGELQGRQQSMKKMFTAWRKGKNWSEIAQILDIPSGKEGKRLQHLRGELQEKLETYLSYLALQKDQLLKGSLLLLEIDRRMGHEIFPKIERKVEKQRIELSNRDASYHRAAFLHASARQSYNSKYPYNYKKSTEVLQKRMFHWRMWVQFEAFELAFNLQRKPWNTELQKLRSLINWGSLDLMGESSHLQLMRKIYHLYEHELWTQHMPDQDKILIQQLEINQPGFSHDTFATLHILVFNYFRRKVYYDSDTQNYLILKNLYEWNERDQLWPVPFSRRTYKTINSLFATLIFITSSKVEKSTYIKEAQHFLEEYHELLPENERKNVKKLNQAHIHFSKGQFEKVIFPALTEDFKDPFYTMSYEVIRIQALFELNRHDEIPDEIQRLRHRVQKSDRFDVIQKKAYQNRLNLLSRLTKVKSSEEAKKLLHKIRAAQPLSGRAWLEQKTHALIK